MVVMVFVPFELSTLFMLLMPFMCPWITFFRWLFWVVICMSLWCSNVVLRILDQCNSEFTFSGSERMSKPLKPKRL